MEEKEKKIFEDNGLNYTVSKRKFHLPSIGETNYYAIVNDSTEEVISTCKERYKVVQNDEIMDIIKSIFPDSTLVDCGHFDNGGKTYYFLRPYGHDVTTHNIGSHEIDYYYYVLNSHDGTSGLRFGTASKVISCSNMFSTLPGESSFVIKHTTNLEENANIKANIIAGLNSMITQEHDTYLNWRSCGLLISHLNHPQCENVIKRAMGVDPRIPNDKLSAKQMIRFNTLKNFCSKEMTRLGRNLFGFYNGFTYYCTNILGARASDKGINPHKTILKGVGSEINTRAFKATQLLYESRQAPS
jgi:hypothetical protein|tara:strand:- start:205 stop:1104 length:900 start_codon:yes stop_codon:yes gene_type:complete